jgi:hypothetical protein
MTTATGGLALAGCGPRRLQPGSLAPAGGGTGVGPSGTGGRGAAGSAGAQASGTGASAASTASPAAPVGAANVGLYLTILSGSMVQKKGWPLFTPADFAVPAGRVTYAEIRCFDPGASPVPAAYAQVRGAIGGAAVVSPLVLGAGTEALAHTVRALPVGGIAHTFTVPAIGLNIPVPPRSIVRFAFNPGAAATLTWRCMAACSTGPAGTAGAMATPGWMRGTLRVLA